MTRLLAVFAALALVPAALADGGPSPGATDGGGGVLGVGVRYVTLGSGATTQLETVATKGGLVKNWVALRGRWGIPLVAYDGTAGGLSYDGSTLVLAKSNPFTCGPKGCSLVETDLAVYAPKTLRRRAMIHLKGVFSYDALSPDGRTLYLIHYIALNDLTKYQVRAYDLAAGNLRPGTIADRTQRGWIMSGQPMTRVTSPGGRYAYTLYANGADYPFVHALDTVRGTAHCIELPWEGGQNLFADERLTLADGGRTLRVADPFVQTAGRAPTYTIDTRTYKVSAHG